MIEVVSPGLFTTLQDLGRKGGRRYGIPPGGALDRVAARAANTLVGNPSGAAVLEMTLQGPRLYFEEKSLVAVSGAVWPVTVDGRPLPTWTSLFIRAGQTLEIGLEYQGQRGARTYLAVSGGFEGPLFLGSRSTYTKAALSGYRGLGRALQPGDRLEIGAGRQPFPALLAGRSWPPPQIPPYAPAVTVHVTPGPHQDLFTEASLSDFFQEEYRVAPASDRMGLRLEGLPLGFNLADFELASYGAVFGAIQVPPNGQPIVLMADHQVTGGYPLLGVVIEADLPLLAQLLPGNKVHFAPV